ncbi:TPA: hypothetical protein QH074_004290 [Enterobacter hormaechei subsp. steigerwaltii]|nr:hypothetical protein [Enterobacter hormaechei subsp. steigerwaltii]
MENTLLSRAEITTLLGFCRSTFYGLKKIHPDFPEPCGARSQVPVYDKEEIARFFFKSAPKFLTRTPEGRELYAELILDKKVN